MVAAFFEKLAHFLACVAKVGQNTVEFSMKRREMLKSEVCSGVQSIRELFGD